MSRYRKAVTRFPKLICLALGLLSATGFEPLGWWPLTLLALALFMTVVERADRTKSALAQGYWFGVGHFVVGLNWIAGSFRYQDTMPVWLGWIAVTALALYLAVYPALAAGVAWRWGRQRRAAFVLLFAAAWIVTEWLRATMFTGFAWNPLGAVLIPVGALPQASVLIGTYGLSALTILISGGLMLAFARRWGLAALLLSPLLAGLLPKDLPVTANSKYRPLLRIVQPNIGQQDKHDEGFDTINFQKLESLTGTPGREPRLILWPEAAVPEYLEEEEWARARIAALMGPKDRLLTGGTALIFDKMGLVKGARNSSFVMTPGGDLIGRYDKSHLVPYGEYLALRWLLEPLGAKRLVPGDIDFIPGPGPQTLAVSPFGRIGVQICYEIIFSGDVVDANNRPDFIFNPSNDAWFGSWGPPQHLAQARLRAIEEGLPVVRSTPTGISAIIDANGVVVKALPYQKPGFIEARLPLAHAPTPFARYGNSLSFGFAFFLCALGIALRAKRR